MYQSYRQDQSVCFQWDVMYFWSPFFQALDSLIGRAREQSALCKGCLRRRSVLFCFLIKGPKLQSAVGCFGNLPRASGLPLIYIDICISAFCYDFLFVFLINSETQLEYILDGFFFFFLKFETLRNVLGMLVWFYIADILSTTHTSCFERNKAVHSTSAHPPLRTNLLWYCSPLEKIPLGMPRGDLQCFFWCVGNHTCGQWKSS